MNGLVHIVAVGARTPVGLTAESSAAAVRARISRIREHPFMVDMRGQPARMACDARLDPLLAGHARMLALARAALSEVVLKVQAPIGQLQGQFPLYLGLSQDRLAWNEKTARLLLQGLTAGPNFGTEAWKITPFREGHASSLEALGQATQGILAGQFPLCVVGGVDTLVDSEALLWIDSLGRLAAESVRSGFPPGEGAGFLALASDSARAHLGLPSLGIVRGIGSAVESKLRTSDDVCLGEGLTMAMMRALATVEPGRVVDDVYCDINGERYRTEEWGFALLRVQERLRSTTYKTPVGEYGDVGAATGALLLILAVQAWQRGYSSGDLSMVWSSSDRGLRSAAVLQRGNAQ
jgi:3-oxoacyl-[acyl-carrier-protein] synthase I